MFTTISGRACLVLQVIAASDPRVSPSVTEGLAEGGGWLFFVET